MPAQHLAVLTPSRVIVTSRWFLTGSLPSVTPAPEPVHVPVVLPGERVAAQAVAAFHGVTGRPWLLAAAAGVAIAVIIGWQTARTRLHQWRHQRLAGHAQQVTITPPPEADPAGAGLWWANLAGLLRPAPWRRLVYGTPHVGLEYRWAGRHLQIVVWVPGTVPAGPVAAAARAAWPGASTRIQDATSPLPGPAGPGRRPGSAGVLVPREAGAALTTALAAWYPLAAAKDQAVDPLRALIGAGAGLHASERACVQVLARPASPRQISRARAGAGSLRTGGPATQNVPGSLLNGALDVLLNLSTRTRATARPATRAGSATGGARTGSGDPLRERDAGPGLEKVASPMWEVAIRLAVTSPARPGGPDDGGADDVPGRRLTGLAHALASAMAVHDARNRLRRVRLHNPVAVLASRVMRTGFLVSAGELASLAGLPADVTVPGLDRARAKTVPAPIAVPAGGRGTKVLGRAQSGGHRVALPVTDAREHLHVLGSTGAGKSTFMTHLILDDIKAGRGMVLIDPKGDLALDILDRLPAGAADRLTLIDPDQPSGSATFNPLELRAGSDPDLIADNLVSIFAAIFQRHWGPRIDDVLRVSCLTLMRHPDPNLKNVPPLLNDKQFRAPFTVGLDDPAGLKGFWEWYESTPANLRAQVIGPVLARLRSFLLREFVRTTIGSRNSSFDIRRVLDSGGILIARLPKGQLGEDTSRLLGSMIFASVWQAATARARIPEPQRKDASVYIDEAHNILNLSGSVSDMLAEARGYHLSLVVAHQHLAQLPRDTQLDLSANARNKIFFNCSPEDARQLARHTLPELDEHDLNHLDAYIAAARLSVGNRETAAFTLATDPPPPATGQREQLRAVIAEKAPPPDGTPSGGAPGIPSGGTT